MHICTNLLVHTEIVCSFQSLTHYAYATDMASLSGTRIPSKLRVLLHEQGLLACLKRWDYSVDDQASAMQDFMSVEAAEEVFEAGMDDPFTMEGEVLRLDYSHNPPPAAAQAAIDQGPSDWVCDMCQAVNFSRCVTTKLAL